MQGFVYKLIPPRPDFAFTMSDDERTTMNAHVQYWGELTQQGHTIAYGPVNDPAGPYGIGIILADDLATAERLRDEDPAVRSPHGLRAEIAPMIRLVTPNGVYDGTG